MVDRAQEQRPELHRTVVRPFETQPGDTAQPRSCRLLAQRGHHRRLAPAGSCRDDRQSSQTGPVQHRAQPRVGRPRRTRPVARPRGRHDRTASSARPPTRQARAGAHLRGRSDRGGRHALIVDGLAHHPLRVMQDDERRRDDDGDGVEEARMTTVRAVVQVTGRLTSGSLVELEQLDGRPLGARHCCVWPSATRPRCRVSFDVFTISASNWSRSVRWRRPSRLA